MTKINHEYIEKRRPLFHDIPPLLKDKLTAEQWIERIERVPRLSTLQRGWLAWQVWWDMDSNKAALLREYAKKSGAFSLRTGRDAGVKVQCAGKEMKTCPTLCEAMTRIGMIVRRCKDCAQVKGLR